jgi:hypothetical protein
MTHPSSCHNCFEKCPRPTENVGVLALFLFATRQHVAASARRGVTYYCRRHRRRRAYATVVYA